MLIALYRLGCANAYSTAKPQLVNDKYAQALHALKQFENSLITNGLDPIGEGDCVFLYTGLGNLCQNSEWTALSAQDSRARKPVCVE